MQTLPIVWQRLVKGGKTCDRCASTRTELEQAVATLERALAARGSRTSRRLGLSRTGDLGPWTPRAAREPIGQ